MKLVFIVCYFSLASGDLDINKNVPYHDLGLYQPLSRSRQKFSTAVCYGKLCCRSLLCDGCHGNDLCCGYYAVDDCCDVCHDIGL